MVQWNDNSQLEIGSWKRLVVWMLQEHLLLQDPHRSTRMWIIAMHSVQHTTARVQILPITIDTHYQMCALHISVSQLLWCCKSSIYSNLCNNDAINEPVAGWMEPLCLATGTWLIGTPFHDPGCQSLHHQVSRRPAKRLQTREEVARLTMAETNSQGSCPIDYRLVHLAVTP